MKENSGPAAQPPPHGRSPWQHPAAVAATSGRSPRNKHPPPQQQQPSPQVTAPHHHRHRSSGCRPPSPRAAHLEPEQLLVPHAELPHRVRQLEQVPAAATSAMQPVRMSLQWTGSTCAHRWQRRPPTRAQLAAAVAAQGQSPKHAVICGCGAAALPPRPPNAPALARPRRAAGSAGAAHSQLGPEGPRAVAIWCAIASSGAGPR